MSTDGLENFNIRVLALVETRQNMRQNRETAEKLGRDRYRVVFPSTSPVASSADVGR